MRRSIAWAFGGQFFSLVATFAGSIVVARLLSPHEMGIYALGVATLGVIQIVAAFGVGVYVVRAKELAPEMLAAAFTVNAALAILLSAILFGVSWLARPLLGDADAGAVLRVLALGPLIGIAGFLPATMLQREMQFKTMAFISSASICVSAGVTVGCALWGLSYMSPAYGGVTSTVFSAVAYNVVGRSHARLRLSLAGWREMTKFGLQIMSVSGVGAMVSRLTEILVGRLVGIAALGLYSRASNLSNMIFDNIYGTATRVVFTQLAKDYRERGELRSTFLRGLQLITAFMWPLLVGLAILSGPAINILYGEKWLPAAMPLSCLMIAQVLSLCYGMNWELFVLRDELGRQTRLEIMRLLIWLTCFTIGCQFSLTGAAIGTIIAAASGLPIYLPHVHRLAEITRGDLRRIYLQSAMLTAAAVAPSLALMVATGWSPRTSVLMVLPGVGLGIMFWIALLAFLRHPLFDELLIISRRIPGLRWFGTLAVQRR